MLFENAVPLLLDDGNQILVRFVLLGQGFGVVAANLVLPEGEQHKLLIGGIGFQAVEQQCMSVFSAHAGGQDQGKNVGNRCR